ncbi:MAG: hypothetical protein AB1478_12395, partial [Nitrospirota bacterium]
MDQLTSTITNLFPGLGTQLYVSANNGDYRSNVSGSSGSPLIDSRADGFSDFGPFPVNTIIEVYKPLSAKVTLLGGKIIEFSEGGKARDDLNEEFPGITEFSQHLDENLNPVSVVEIKRFLLGETLSLELIHPLGVEVPELPNSYVIGRAIFNGVGFISFNAFELPGEGMSVTKSNKTDNVVPCQVADFQFTTFGEKVTLSWKPNIESDLMGYNVYQKIGLDILEIGFAEKDKSTHTVGSGLGGSGEFLIKAFDSTGNFSVQNSVLIGNYIYVDDSGSDERGDGTISDPYRTIGKAVSVLPQAPEISYVISIFPGTYSERVDLNNGSRLWDAQKGLIFKARYDKADSMPLWQRGTN